MLTSNWCLADSAPPPSSPLAMRDADRLHHIASSHALCTLRQQQPSFIPNIAHTFLLVHAHTYQIRVGRFSLAPRYRSRGGRPSCHPVPASLQPATELLQTTNTYTHTNHAYTKELILHPCTAEETRSNCAEPISRCVPRDNHNKLNP